MNPLTYEVDALFLQDFLVDIQKFSEITSFDVLSVEIAGHEYDVPTNGLVFVEGHRIFFKQLVSYISQKYTIDCLNIPINVQVQIIGKEWILAGCFRLFATTNTFSNNGDVRHSMQRFFLTFYEEQDLVVYKMMTDLASVILQKPVC